MLKWNLIPALTLMLSLVACKTSDAHGSRPPENNPSNDSTHSQTPDEKHPQPSYGQNSFKDAITGDCRADSANPLSCLAPACEKAQGHFQSETQTCDCGTGKYFTALFGGRCLAMATPFETSAYSEFLIALKNHQKKIPYLSLTSTRDEDSEQGLSFSEFGLFVNGQASADDAVREFETTATSGVSTQLPLVPSGTFQTRIYLGGTVSNKDLLANLAPVETKLQDNSSATPLQRTFIATDLHHVAQIIRSEINANLQVDEPSDGDALKKAVKLAYDRRDSDWTHFDSFTDYSNNGCAGRCRLRKGIAITELAMTAFEEREVSGGVVLKDQILIFAKGDDSAANAVIEIDPSGAPNLVYLLSNQGSGPIARKISVFNRSWTRLTNDFELSFASIQTARNAQSADSGSVVVCEDGFKSSYNASLSNGPYSYNDGRGSIFGWLENRDGDINQALSGLKHMSQSGVPDTTQAWEEHAGLVTELAASHLETTVIPMGLAACYGRYSEWKPTVRATGARVINVSYSMPFESESCAKDPVFAQSVLDPEHTFLWIVSAGNDSRHNVMPNQVHNCPQNIGPVPNLITVASGTAWYPANYSNDGKFYADIAADGRANSGEEGTSFAAPKVARVAAEIAKHYDLSPEEIRLVLLLSAEVPGSGPKIWPMPVRSGGVLNELTALKFASYLKTNSWIAQYPEQLLNHFRCVSKDTCAQTSAQVQYLKETGIIK